MSSMPLISHRLFVAAIGSEGNTPAKSTQNEAGSTRVTGLATAIPMELIEGARLKGPLPLGHTLKNAAQICDP